MHYNSEIESVEDPGAPEPRFSVFNADNSVGVWADHNGETVDVQLSADALRYGDQWLSDEIVMVAGLAHDQARVALGKEMLEAGRRRGELGVAHAREMIREMGLPSEDEYRRMLDAKLYGGE